jgi:hypothetical protein
VRERAPLELPHVMVLIDDPQHLVIDPLFARTAGAAVRCSADADSGRVRGWRLDHPLLIQWVVEQLSAIGGPGGVQPPVMA